MRGYSIEGSICLNHSSYPMRGSRRGRWRHSLKDKGAEAVFGMMQKAIRLAEDRSRFRRTIWEVTLWKSAFMMYNIVHTYSGFLTYCQVASYRCHWGQGLHQRAASRLWKSKDDIRTNIEILTAKNISF